MQRHPYEWPILAENHWPNHGRKLTELVMENALLRQQLIVLEPQNTRPQLTWRDWTLIVLLASKLRRWKGALTIVQPDTVLRWHRDLFRRYWRRKSRSRSQCGRPPLVEDVVALIKQMAAVRAERENATWGAERIRGELSKIGVEVSKSSIQKVMADVRKHRASKQTWAAFLPNHASEIWACDFLQTYDLFFSTVFVLEIIELGSRRIVHFGVTRNPNSSEPRQGSMYWKRRIALPERTLCVSASSAVFDGSVSTTS